MLVEEVLDLPFLGKMQDLDLAGEAMVEMMEWMDLMEAQTQEAVVVDLDHQTLISAATEDQERLF
jgi:hypothetical protein